MTQEGPNKCQRVSQFIGWLNNTRTSALCNAHAMNNTQALRLRDASLCPPSHCHGRAHVHWTEWNARSLPIHLFLFYFSLSQAVVKFSYLKYSYNTNLLCQQRVNSWHNFSIYWVSKSGKDWYVHEKLRTLKTKQIKIKILMFLIPFLFLTFFFSPLLLFTPRKK